MTLKNFIKGALSAAAITMAGSFAYAQQAGGSLVFLVQPEPPTMAGYVSTSGPIGLLGPKIYDGLVDYDNDGKMVPMLAESVDVSADGKTITFNLRKGVTWHDGEAFTSEDVQFTIMDVLKKFTQEGQIPLKKFLASTLQTITLQYLTWTIQHLTCCVHYPLTSPQWCQNITWKDRT